MRRAKLNWREADDKRQLSAQQSHKSNLFLDINTHLQTYSTLAILKDAAKLETF